jgi:MFS family permease
MFLLIQPFLGIVARLVATTGVTLNEDPTQLPGGTALQGLVNGLGGWALIVALVGLLIGAGAWALGAHSQNYQQSYTGRKAVLISGLAALLIGAAPALINFFFHTGLGIKSP